MNRPFVASLATLSVALTSCFSARNLPADERLKGIACRSVHLAYPADRGIAFTNEIIVEESAPGSYFMVCGWDRGYFGLQELGDGKKLILFSVWDSDQDDPKAVGAERRTKLVFKDPAVGVGRFGGEGTGGQAFFDYDWKVGATYRLLVTSNLSGDRIEYTGHFLDPETRAWRRLVTFSTPALSKDLGGYYAFIEDFKRDRVSATRARKARFGGAWIVKPGGEPSPIGAARFTADANPVLNIDAGASGDRFFLATGGETKNEGAKLKQMIRLPVEGPRMPPEGLRRLSGKD